MQSPDDRQLAADFVTLAVCDVVHVNAAGDFVAGIVGQVPGDRRAVGMQFLRFMTRDRENLDRRAQG